MDLVAKGGANDNSRDLSFSACSNSMCVVYALHEVYAWVGLQGHLTLPGLHHTVRAAAINYTTKD